LNTHRYQLKIASCSVLQVTSFVEMVFSPAQSIGDLREIRSNFYSKVAQYITFRDDGRRKASRARPGSASRPAIATTVNSALWVLPS
jgi:hypothetical protein